MDTIRQREGKPFISDFNPMAKVQAMRDRIAGETHWNEKTGSGDNLLKNHRFVSLRAWQPIGEEDLGYFLSTLSANHHAQGQNAVLMRSLLAENIQKGLMQRTDRLPAGQYTFSAYIMPYTNIVGGMEQSGVYLTVTNPAGRILGESERLKLHLDRYERLSCSFNLSTAQQVNVGIWISGMGTVFVNAPQLEQGATAGKYNLLENGSFENGEQGWNISCGGVISYIKKEMSSSLFLKSGEKGALAVQNVQEKLYAHERAVYTLSGWSKIPLKPQDEECVFPQLFARICYSDGTDETHGTSFAKTTTGWQFAAVRFYKSRCKDMQNIEVYCRYAGRKRAYFDQLHLVRERYESGLSSKDFV
ncbi:MAG: hypothetical protein HFE66_07825 [Clostridiales bacterium]|jgi:hypothetical protein|nr:hypothetical protein [Clostridiales bacterium]